MMSNPCKDVSQKSRPSSHNDLTEQCCTRGYHSHFKCWTETWTRRRRAPNFSVPRRSIVRVKCCDGEGHLLRTAGVQAALRHATVARALATLFPLPFILLSFWNYLVPFPFPSVSRPLERPSIQGFLTSTGLLAFVFSLSVCGFVNVWDAATTFFFVQVAKPIVYSYFLRLYPAALRPWRVRGMH